MDIKIFQSYHKSTARLKTNILTPIHVGRAIASEKNKEELADIIGDDTGDNISAKNKNYCELTAQYWAWKNCSTDYIGFMHYRRHLSFNIKENYKENEWGVIDYDYINKYYIDSFALSDDNIKKIVSDCDIITVKEWNVNNAGSKNNYEHYKYSDKKLHIKDYDKAIDILLKKYPEYKEAVKNYNNSETGYYTNIFVMRKNIFSDYCVWLFDILFELEREIDISEYNIEEARVFGYISEWLFGIYIYHLKITSDKKIKELQRTFVHNVDIVQNNENINICFSSDDNYAKHLAVAIASILKNTKTRKTIDIYILHSNIKKDNIEKIKILRKINNNIEANFYFIKIDNAMFDNIYLRNGFHVTLATYYRYVLPSIFNSLKKMLYIDCDILSVGDIEELYCINIDNYYIAATQDIIGFENQVRLKINTNAKYYYCNAGVMLVNLESFRKDDIEKKLFDFTYEKMHNLLYLDQDVINIVCEDKIKYLDLSYNLQTYPNAKVDYNDDEYKKAIKNPKIIHFIGEEKPWHIGNKRLFRNLYFKYLKLTAWKNDCWRIFFAEKIFLKYDKGVYRKYRILGFTITIKPLTLQFNKLYWDITDRINLLEHNTHDRIVLSENNLDNKISLLENGLNEKLNLIEKYINNIKLEIINRDKEKLTPLSSHNFAMRQYMIDNQDKFISEINEFKKNLDNESLNILQNNLNQISSFVNNKIPWESFYTIPNNVNFFTDEQKIVWGNRHNIFNFLYNKYKKYDPNDLFLTLHIFYYEAGIIYLPTKVKERFNNSIAIDGGAYIGDSAIMFSEEYNFSVIHSFEPIQTIFDRLQLSVKKYNLADRIKTHQFALSDKNESLYMIEQNDGSVVVENTNSNNNYEKIRAIRLDDYMKDTHNDISLIKLDVEGYEEKALAGAENIIKKYKPVLLISCYHDWHSISLGQMFRLKKYIESLNLGYKIMFRGLSPDSNLEYTLICYTER